MPGRGSSARGRRTLLYLIGEPGVGKSTLMASLTARWVRAPLPGQPGRDALADRRSGQVVAVELGRRRRAFSGTDALPMDAVVAAERYVRSGQAARETALLLGEGARLGCARFLAAAVAGGWTVELVYLHGTEVAAQRRAGRAAGQDERWVRGAATRARRLAEGPPAGVLVHRVDVAAEVTLPDVPGLFDAGLCA